MVLQMISRDGRVSFLYGVITWLAVNALNNQIEMFSIDRMFCASFKATDGLE